ncbi:hypothetical protein [Thermopirellula anaerolimosa]
MLWIVLCVTLAVVESGDWSAIFRAQQLFHEVYGKRIEAAKTSAEKSALAREILDVAKKESDSAAKTVELEQAKRLAVEAHDLAIAIEAVRVIAAQSPKDERSDDEQLLKAEEVWQEAESKTGVDKLYTQLDALQEFFRVSSPPVLVKNRWEQRIEQVTSGGGIVLKAKDAKLVGRHLVYVSNIDRITAWSEPNEYVEWHAELRSGTYEVSIEYTGPWRGPLSVFAVGVFRNNSRTPISARFFSLEKTETWDTAKTITVGSVRVPKSDSYTVRLWIVRKDKDIRPGYPTIDVKSIRLNGTK